MILDDLLARQLRIMPAFGVQAEAGERDFLPHLHSALTSLVIESAEAAADIETVTRPWKRKPLEVVKAHLFEETVDVLFFLLEIWIMLGMTEQDVVAQYDSKYRRNLLRVLAASDKGDRTIALNAAAKELGRDYDLTIMIMPADELYAHNYERLRYKDQLRWPAYVAAYELLRSYPDVNLQKVIDDPLSC